MKVFINPGHDINLDSGAVGYFGTRECDVVKNVGEKLVGYLNAVGIETEILQDDSLSKIVGLANASGADIFVSLHCNAAENRNAEGTETFYHPASFKGQKLATKINDQLVGLELTDRGIKNGDWLYVIKHTAMPAVLVELDFISNIEQEQFLASDDGQTDLAKAVARGITDYMQ